VYPFGISVGRVASVEKDPYSKNTVAYIEPAVDFSSVDRVMVVAEQILEDSPDEQ
jgi:cell shape-determining protein MreC